MEHSNDAAFVTGAGSGIGRAIALRLAQDGNDVAVVDIEAAGAAQTAKEATRFGVRAVALPCDVGSERDVVHAFEECQTKLGIPQRVVANAGIEIARRAHETSLEEWQRVIDVNLTGVFLTCREAVRILIGAGLTGSILCVSSPSAFVGFAGGENTAYGSSKGGVSAFVRALAIDYARDGIRVNGVVPGATATSLLEVTLGGDSAVTERVQAQIPLGRLGMPEEVAEAAAWLLSDRASYVTGSHLFVDGGLTARGANDF
jgi:glucose 1-dehydrogenase